MPSPAYFLETKAAGTSVEIDFGDKDAPKNYAIGYWSIRGLGAPLTMMLCAAKTPFTLFLYDIVEATEGDAPSGWHSEYFGAKADYIKSFGQPLWNLPFCVDRANERVICQTNAVFAHIGRSCGMFGDDDVAATSEIEELLCEVYDLRNVMVDFAYGSGDSSPIASVLANAKQHLTKLESWLEIQAGKNESKQAQTTVVVHLVNGKFSAPDFHLFEMLDQFEALAVENGEDLYSNLKRLKEFKEGFASLPENQFYLNSWLHKELPINNCMAKFGSLPGPKKYVHGESAKAATWRAKGVVSLSP